MNASTRSTEGEMKKEEMLESSLMFLFLSSLQVVKWIYQKRQKLQSYNQLINV